MWPTSWLAAPAAVSGRAVRSAGAAVGAVALLLATVLVWRTARGGGGGGDGGDGKADTVARVLPAQWAVHGALPMLRVGGPYCIEPALRRKAFDDHELAQAARDAARWWQFEAGTALALLYDAEPANKAGRYVGEPELARDHRRFDMLGPVGPLCRSGLVSYGEGDMEKRVCGLEFLTAAGTAATTASGSSEPQSSGGCHILSVGSNNQWGFEEAVFRTTACEISTFDCTVHMVVPAAIQARTTAYHVCLGARDEVHVASGRTFVSWQSMLNLAGLKGPPTHLKMDIEGYEYQVIRSILRSGVHLPQQISMELHFTPVGGVLQSARHVTAGELALFARELFDVGQYLLIDRNDNPYCTSCTEVLYKRFGCQPEQL